MWGSEPLWCNEGIAKVADWNAVVYQFEFLPLGGLSSWRTLLMIMNGEHLGTGAGTGEMKCTTNNTNVYKQNMDINWMFIINIRQGLYKYIDNWLQKRRDLVSLIIITIEYFAF